MNDLLQSLARLQTDDTRIASLKAEKAAMPKQLEAIAERRQTSRVELKSIEARLDAAEKERRALEGEVQEATERLRKYKTQLYQIKTNKEYQAMLHEIEATEKRISETEDRVLMAMESIDASKAALVAARSADEESKKVCAEEEVKLQARLSAIEAAIAESEAERARIIADMDAEALRRYEQIRTRRGGLAVVEARQGTCLGCRVELPPQLYIELLKGDALLSCPSCQRILFARAPTTP
jgi:predicted  nucleic acid-binding Zn-ribbon protein